MTWRLSLILPQSLSSNSPFRTRLKIQVVLALSAILILTLFNSGLANSPNSSPSLLAVQGSDVITAENISQVTELSNWGLGVALDLTLAGNGKVWVVLTPFGLFLYNAETMESVGVINNIESYWLSPDTDLLLTSSRGSPALNVWNSKDGSLVTSLIHNAILPEYQGHNFDPIAYQSVLDVSFSQDQKMMAVSYGDHQVEVWEPSTWKSLKLLTANIAPPADKIAFSNDGEYIITSNGFMAIWRLKDGKLLNRIPGGWEISDNPVSPDGKYLATSRFGRIYLWSFPGGRFLRSFGYNGLADVRFTQDSRYFIINNAEIRRLENGTRLPVDRESNILYPDGKPTSSSPETSPSVPDLEELGHWSGLEGSAFDANHSIKSWGITKDNEIHWRDLISGDDAQYQLEKSPLNKLAPNPERDKLYLCLSKELISFSPMDEQVQSFPGCKKSGALKFAEDSTLARASGILVDLVNSEDGTLEHNLRGHTQNVTSIAFSPDGQLIASGTRVSNRGAELFLWNRDPLLSIWQKWTVSSESGNAELKSIVFSPDSSLVAIGGADSHVKIYRVSDGWQLRILNIAGSANDLAFSPDGNLLAAAGSDGTIKLWSIPDGKELAMLYGHRQSVVDLEFSQDGKEILSTSTDGTVRLWGLP